MALPLPKMVHTTLATLLLEFSNAQSLKDYLIRQPCSARRTKSKQRKLWRLRNSDKRESHLKLALNVTRMEKLLLKARTWKLTFLPRVLHLNWIKTIQRTLCSEVEVISLVVVCTEIVLMEDRVPTTTPYLLNWEIMGIFLKLSLALKEWNSLTQRQFLKRLLMQLLTKAKLKSPKQKFKKKAKRKLSKVSTRRTI